MFTRIFTVFIALGICGSANASNRNALCSANQVDGSTMVSVDEANLSVDQDTLHLAFQQAVESGKRLDWVDDEGASCGGYYQPPTNPNPEALTDAKDAQTYISAQNFQHQANNVSVLSGDVELYQGAMRLRCDSMMFSAAQNHAELQGNIQLRDNGILLLADQATVNMDTQQSWLNNSEYLLHDSFLHGWAESMHFDNSGSGVLNMQQASFSACPPTRQHWSISAKEIELDNESGWGKAYGSWFHLFDVPVAYIPYIDFPIDDQRKTGLLFPTFSSTGSGGIDVTLPIYFNLAPNYDLTYTPRYNNEHGILHGVQARYKGEYGQWLVGGSYIHEDKMIGGVSTGGNPDMESSRSSSLVQYQGRFNDNWSANIDYSNVSDINYFRDWGTTGLDIRKTLNIKRQAHLQYQDSNWLLRGSIVDYQNLEQETLDDGSIQSKESDYSNFPRLDIQYGGSGKAFELTPLYTSQYTNFTHDTLIQAQRFYNEAGIVYPLSWPALDIRPTMKVRRSDYSYKDAVATDGTTPQPGSDKTDITATTFTLDNKLHLEREFSLAGQSLLQTLEPRLYYHYTRADEGQEDMPSFDTEEMDFSYSQLYRDSRFSGYDRIGDANQLTVGRQSEFFDATTGANVLHLGIGQIHYFQDRTVSVNATDTEDIIIDPNDSEAVKQQKRAQQREIDKKYYRSASDIAAQARWSLDSEQSIHAGMIWDPYDAVQEELSIAYQYHNENGFLVNTGLRYNKELPLVVTDEVSGAETLFDNNLEQVDVSFFVPLNPEWYLFASSNYDINKKERIDNIAGLQYEGCCINMKFAFRSERMTFEYGETIDNSAEASYDKAIFFEFVFKGLGTVSSSLSRILEEQIQGYNSK